MIQFCRYGGCSSMAEPRTVDAVVVGSTPISHPWKMKTVYIDGFFRVNHQKTLLLNFSQIAHSLLLFLVMDSAEIS